MAGITLSAPAAEKISNLCAEQNQDRDFVSESSEVAAPA
jgi:hypothetical protein